jgi:hypothetical protein
MSDEQRDGGRSGGVLLWRRPGSASEEDGRLAKGRGVRLGSGLELADFNVRGWMLIFSRPTDAAASLLLLFVSLGLGVAAW